MRWWAGVSPARIGKSAPILRLVTFSLPFLLRLASSRLARETSCRTPGALVFDKRTVKLGKAGLFSVGWREPVRIVADPPVATMADAVAKAT